MTRKNNHRLRNKSAARKNHRKSRSTDSSMPLIEQKVTNILVNQKKPISLSDIAAAIHLSRKERPRLAKLLEEMTTKKKLQKKGKRFCLAFGKDLVRAKLDLTAKGFGFATVKNQAPKEKDIFIAARDLNGASHGDTILVAITHFARGRREGRVIQVLSRAITSLCGIFNASGTSGYVTPDNDRLPYTVLIGKDNTSNAEDGMAVVVEIIDYGNERQSPQGKITQILGDPYNTEVQIRMAILEAKLRDHFPDAVIAQAEKLQPLTTCSDDRQDLQHIPHVTIDGADARDFDDAIAVEQTATGFTLYVSIADVSHYVKPGSAIDQEAYARGTSVYLPDRVLPMLPERLSNNLCSLVPEKPRPAFTAILRFDKTGHRIDEQYTKSLIKSRRRFTYSTIYQLLYQQDQLLLQQHADLLPMLENAKTLTTLLAGQRARRGSLGFNIPEPSIQVAQGKVTTITLSERNQAHMLIEECMLAANEAVAETLATHGRQALFRIHENPDPTKVESFVDVCKALAVIIPTTAKTPAWFAEVIATTAGTPREYVINNLLLRTMQQARYAAENTGHFGLAAEYYLHFTSPIRRYPDLIAHRALHALLRRETGDTRLLPQSSGYNALVEAGKNLSGCERKAITVERNVHARLAAVYMRDKVGEQYPAVISGVTSFGLFVELQKEYISGAIPVQTMKDDYYLHDAKRHRLIGERTNRIFQLGDTVEVTLDHVDILSKRITFSLATAEDN
ncbi:ribonuclease R [Desulfogranum marinum]|uniref:ribonuclease R n=1 Tax=Desulfogranum marinum TaxID=453220 RepID=UPI0019668E48|nr:ribonuclease R [Desulfogranum marinum]MBM9514088.1 ribonuclease R [Desulfogranum marinum]